MPIDRSYLSRSIYALIDPRDGLIYYVGCAIDVKKRYEEHLRDKSKTRKCQWLAELKQYSLQPKLEILEIVDNFFGAFSKEDYWIGKMLSTGMPLTNAVIRKGVFTKPDKTIFVPFNWKGTKLRYMRTRLGISKETLVKRAGITVSAYGRAESGYPVKCSIARDILDAFNSLLLEEGQAEVSLDTLGWIQE